MVKDLLRDDTYLNGRVSCKRSKDFSKELVFETWKSSIRVLMTSLLFTGKKNEMCIVCQVCMTVKLMFLPIKTKTNRLIHVCDYKTHMGGVDLHDLAINLLLHRAEGRDEVEESILETVKQQCSTSKLYTTLCMAKVRRWPERFSGCNLLSLTADLIAHCANQWGCQAPSHSQAALHLIHMVEKVYSLC